MIDIFVTKGSSHRFPTKKYGNIDYATGKETKTKRKEAVIEDIAASIYQAVVNQTIAGLAQGRPIKGNILYLGGPLTFSRVLRASFDKTLGVKGTCPENSLLFVALGAAFYADQEFDLKEVADRLQAHGASETYRSQPPLFANEEEYEAFKARHAKATVPRVPFGPDYAAPVHIGIDSGSTTVKMTVIDQDARILFTDYRPNLGNPVPLIREVLQQLYDEHPALHVASVTTTGYGEDLAKNAFHADYGVVETVAHFTAARHFLPNVDFIIDIGGQDMKCFKIRNDAVDSNYGRSGAITIAGGNVFAYSATGSEEGIDCDNNSYIVVTGGIAVSAGGRMGSSGTSSIGSSTQGYYLGASPSSYSSTNYYTLCNTSGEAICTYKFASNVSNSLGLLTASNLGKGSITIKTGTEKPTACDVSVNDVFFINPTVTTTGTAATVTAK